MDLNDYGHSYTRPHQDVGMYTGWPALEWCSSDYDPRFRPWCASAYTLKPLSHRHAYFI